jgi:cation diffusion facilitator CzcD-associated flavoprotein CzcO
MSAMAPCLRLELEMVASGLEELTCRAQYEMQCLGYPARPWVPATMLDGEQVHDAVIVGGGQSGVSIAFGLMRERVVDVVVLDRSPRGSEGPWNTFARMHTLRTPKTVTGPDLGIPSLSARAWYEAKFGAQAWDKLDKIPRGLWQEYLLWLRETIGIPVRSSVEVVDIEPLTPDILAVHVRGSEDGRAMPRLLARKVVLATGIEGTGRWLVPSVIERNVPRALYAHTSEAIDFGKLAGKRVAVVGAGASAFDNAACALEQGAASVDLLVRRDAIPAINPNRWMEFTGFQRHFGDLSDEQKWRFMTLLFELNQPPPQDTFDRCAIFDNFRVHLASPLKSVAAEGERLTLTTPRSVLTADFLIVGTGLAIDFEARPELKRFATAIARWRDRFPPASSDNDALADYPYLSDSFQFMERVPGEAAALRHIHCYTYAAMPSLAGSAGISALKFGAARLINGITRDLFVADAETHLAALRNYSEKELIRTALASDDAQSARVA